MSKAPVYATWDETGLGLNDIPTGIAITNPKIYINLPPGNTVHVEKRKRCCSRAHL